MAKIKFGTKKFVTFYSRNLLTSDIGFVEHISHSLFDLLHGWAEELAHGVWHETQHSPGTTTARPCYHNDGLRSLPASPKIK